LAHLGAHNLLLSLPNISIVTEVLEMVVVLEEEVEVSHSETSSNWRTGNTW